MEQALGVATEEAMESATQAVGQSLRHPMRGFGAGRNEPAVPSAAARLGRLGSGGLSRPNGRPALRPAETAGPFRCTPPQNIPRLGTPFFHPLSPIFHPSFAHFHHIHSFLG